MYRPHTSPAFRNNEDRSNNICTEAQMGKYIWTMRKENQLFIFPYVTIDSATTVVTANNTFFLDMFWWQTAYFDGHVQECNQCIVYLKYRLS